MKKTFLIAAALPSLVAGGVRYLGSLARPAPALSSVFSADR